MLTIIFWLLLLLCAIGYFAPPSWTYASRGLGIIQIILFAILGYKVLKVAL